MPRQNPAPSDYPQAVLQQIQQLGQHIAIARQRRGESQAQWAHKLGISQPTMARMERGDPSVAMASYAMCIWLINPAAGVAELIAPARDHVALEKEVAKVRAKRRPAHQAPQEANPAAPAPATDANAPHQTRTHSTLVALAENAQPSSSSIHTQQLRTPAQGIAALLAKTAPPQ